MADFVICTHTSFDIQEHRHVVLLGLVVRSCLLARKKGIPYVCVDMSPGNDVAELLQSVGATIIESTSKTVCIRDSIRAALPLVKTGGVVAYQRAGTTDEVTRGLEHAASHLNKYSADAIVLGRTRGSMQRSYTPQRAHIEEFANLEIDKMATNAGMLSPNESLDWIFCHVAFRKEIAHQFLSFEEEFPHKREEAHKTNLFGIKCRSIIIPIVRCFLNGSKIGSVSFDYYRPPLLKKTLDKTIEPPWSGKCLPDLHLLLLDIKSEFPTMTSQKIEAELNANEIVLDKNVSGFRASRDEASKLIERLTHEFIQEKSSPGELRREKKISRLRKQRDQALLSVKSARDKMFAIGMKSKSLDLNVEMGEKKEKDQTLKVESKRSSI